MQHRPAALHALPDRVRRGRTIVLGLDTVDLLLVERWAAEGHLPFFRKLLSECPLVRLSALSRVLQGALWPSVLTGVSPAHHGRYSFAQLAKGSYHLDPVRADRVTLPRFYTVLGAHGVRCAAIDIPTDLPQPTFPGIQVVDWGTEFALWDFATQPSDFKDHIVARYGRHYHTDQPLTGETSANHRKVLGNLRTGVKQKSALVRELLGRSDLDLIFVVYGEPHKAGHFFWKYMDAAHPDHVAAPDLEGALLEMYQLIDSELEALAGLLDEDDNLLVFTDHGMQANYRGEHFVDAILQRLGLSGSPAPAEGDSAISSPLRSSNTGRSVRQSVRGTLHKLVRTVAPAGVTRALRDQFGAASGRNWSQTKAFSLPTDRNTYIRVNLRGREPLGTVSPGAEYEKLLDFIEREFRALINVETGQPAVEEVFRVHEVYPGPRTDDLPDLAILWSSKSPINVLHSQTVGRLEKRIVELRSGNHRPEGFLLARGPKFQPGQRLIQGDILQIAPTLLALHDAPIPNDYAMGPIAELLARASSH